MTGAASDDLMNGKPSGGVREAAPLHMVERFSVQWEDMCPPIVCVISLL